MNDKLIRQLQEVKLIEEDLFPSASKEDLRPRRGAKYCCPSCGVLADKNDEGCCMNCDHDFVEDGKPTIRRSRKNESINEEDLFPNSTPKEVEAREKELEDREARQAEERSRLYSKFKVGDEVEVIGAGVHEYPSVGTKGKVESIHPINFYHPIKVGFDIGSGNKDFNWYDVNGVAKIEKE